MMKLNLVETVASIIICLRNKCVVYIFFLKVVFFTLHILQSVS